MGQRQVLRHGDNIRFGFDSKVWTVDCTGSNSRHLRELAAADDRWKHEGGGAAILKAAEREPVAPPPQLPSGVTPCAKFFDQPSYPPAHDLRTSESGAEIVGATYAPQRHCRSPATQSPHASVRDVGGACPKSDSGVKDEIRELREPGSADLEAVAYAPGIWGIACTDPQTACVEGSVF